ncbi:D-ribose pyranase [Halobacillus litoralis]|uniref:D-ribose pyranase n=1 Tax=Halobacillus litoralis TaxID=45668 RepID=UPI001CFE1229|nr:D-ribose pyranase [Halobacillus litoralis]
MKKTGVLHPELNKLITEMGHTDELVVTDAGLPLPEEVTTRVDLALVKDMVPFLTVLDNVLNELSIEKVIMAEEIREKSPEMHEEILKRLHGVEVEYVPHVDFKQRTKQARGLVRSGEHTSFANVILVGGVVY